MNELTLFTHVNNFNSLLVLKLAVRILQFCTCGSGRELNYVQKCPRAQLRDEFFFACSGLNKPSQSCTITVIHVVEKQIE